MFEPLRFTESSGLAKSMKGRRSFSNFIANRYKLDFGRLSNCCGQMPNTRSFPEKSILKSYVRNIRLAGFLTAIPFHLLSPRKKSGRRPGKAKWNADAPMSGGTAREEAGSR
jgi:hypothetical protein